MGHPSRINILWLLYVEHVGMVWSTYLSPPATPEWGTPQAGCTRTFWRKARSCRTHLGNLSGNNWTGTVMTVTSLCLGAIHDCGAYRKWCHCKNGVSDQRHETWVWLESHSLMWWWHRNRPGGPLRHLRSESHCTKGTPICLALKPLNIYL